MSRDFNTMELARIYEAQGYFQDALDIYQTLESENRERYPEITDAVRRMESAVQNRENRENKGNLVNQADNEGEQVQDQVSEKRIEYLLEQWLMLMVLKKRLNAFKRLKLRF